MTAATLTYLIAQEHINDLMRDAERRRRVAEVRPLGRLRLSFPRVFARRAARTAVA
jgi:hypothetical protein